MTTKAGENDLLTVPELATRLRVRASWVYSHADELGALRLGKYLRFSWARVLSHLVDGASRQPNQVCIGVPAQRPSPRSIDPRG